MISYPTPATTKNLNPLPQTIQNPSYAAPQKFFPLRAI